MARALAEEVHLDERYVAEHLRDAMAGQSVSQSLREGDRDRDFACACRVRILIYRSCCLLVLYCFSAQHTYSRAHIIGVVYTDALLGPTPLTPPDNHGDYAAIVEAGGGGGDEVSKGSRGGPMRVQQQCCVVS